MVAAAIAASATGGVMKLIYDDQWNAFWTYYRAKHLSTDA